MSEPRIRRTETRKEYEQVVDDFHTQGDVVLNRGERSTMLRKKHWGSGLLHFLLLILTAGVGNIAYALLAYYHIGERALVRLEDQADPRG